MSVDIIRGSSQKPVASEELADIVSGLSGFSGRLFIGYPIVKAPEGPRAMDALLISPEKGIVVFDLIEGGGPGDYRFRQDDLANKLESLLKTHTELTRGRKLLIPIHTVSVSLAPALGVASTEGDYEQTPLVNAETLPVALTELENWDGKRGDICDKALSVLGNVSNIRKNRAPRSVEREDSLGDRLRKLEDSIATLDPLQNMAVVEATEGVQRIRGLAGSGKTVVLAQKAALLHLLHPEWRIAVTFYTRSLKGHFKHLINRFLFEYGVDPDWNGLRVVHAWGGRGTAGDRDGIYSEFCARHDVGYFDFKSAGEEFGRGEEFTGACERALAQVGKDGKICYDAILVDEAQDLPPAFLRICSRLLGDGKRLVYAYDELQNLSGKSLPPPWEIFGRDAEESSKFWSYKQWANDVILRKCYRNSRPVLVAAHALGFGIYRKDRHEQESGLIQMFDHPKLWEEIGYRAKGGSPSLKEGSSVTLYRPEETSPLFLESHSDLNDLVRFVCFDEEREQTEWLVREIRKNLEHDELRHDDIIVINPDPLTTRDNAGPIRSRLLEEGVGSHIAGISTGSDVFFMSESVAFTGIYRAKGNEAGMVYIINAQDCYDARDRRPTAPNLARVRNRLFTAITRSKAWVRVLGVGEEMKLLKEEYDRLAKEDFKLQFAYPTKEQRKRMHMVHRDVSRENGKLIREDRENLSRIVSDIRSGKVRLADFDKETLSELRKELSLTSG